MGFVEHTYTAVDGFLERIAETQFGGMASSLGAVGLLMATLAAGLVIINMQLQVRTQYWDDAFRTLFKIVMVALFFGNWVYFDAVAQAVHGLIWEAANAMVASVSKVSPDADFSGVDAFAGEFDSMSKQVGDFGTEAASELGIVGGGPVLSTGMLIVMGVLNAVAAFVMICSRVMVSVLIGIAPLFILMTLFEATKSYFETWLRSVINFMLWPLIIAGIFSTIVGIMLGVLDQAGDADNLSSIGELVPIFGVAMLSIGLVFAIPMIAGGVTGNFHLRNPVLNLGARALGAAALGLGTSGGRQALGSAAAGAASAAGRAGSAVADGVKNAPKYTQAQGAEFARKLHETANRFHWSNRR